MKNKIKISITIPILVGFLLIGGCATTARITEPTSPGSTLLIGRIKVICTGFPSKWHANGDHTNGVMVKLRDVSNEIISIRAHGADGLLYLVDPDIDRYTIVLLHVQVGTSRTLLDLYYRTSDPIYIKGNSVNNLGDILWRCDYVSKKAAEYTKSGTHTEIKINNSLVYKDNYDEVKAWFEETYPESAWNNKNWVNFR